MADNDMSFRQRAVIEFLVKVEIPAAEIHQRFTSAYGSMCMGAISVRIWVKHFKDGNTILQNQHRCGRPRTISTERNKERADETIQDDKHMTVDTIARTLGIGEYAVQEMIESLGSLKVCARCVPRLLTEDHKGHRKAITSEMLQRYRHEGDDLMLRIVAGYESWFHHFEPEKKRQSMEMHNLHSPSNNKAKTLPSFAMVMSTVFWNAEVLTLAGFLDPGKTITAALYVQTLQNLRRALRDKPPGRNIIILHDNARPLAARFTSEAIAKMGWEALPHPSCSPDLAPFDNHLFGFVKDHLGGQRYGTMEAIQKAMCSCLRVAGTEFYRRGIFKLPER